MEQVKQKVYQPVKLFLNSKFRTVIAGSQYSFAISVDDQLYGWGKNDFGQLGVDNSNSKVKLPVKIMQAKGISVATGSKHTFVYNKFSKVICWGLNQSGQLGLNKPGIVKPCQLKLFSDAYQMGLQVQKISCGQDHSLAIFRDSNNQLSLFSWGSNKYWQLALQTQQDVYNPVKTDFDNQPIDIMAKHNYSMTVTKQGKVYSWGSGQFGRLGFQSMTKQQRIPKLVTGIQKIQKVVLGIYHVIAINFDGRCYSWGRGLNGQLGHNNLSNQNSPKLIQSISHIRVVNAGAGQQHTIFQGRGGDIWSCGGGSYGQLGLTDKTIRTLTPLKLQLPPIVMISTGNRHNLAININGQIFVWGSNQCHQLGIVQTKDYKQQKQQANRQNGLDSLHDRVKLLQDEVDQLKGALLQQRRFKMALLKFMQRTFSQASHGFHKFYKQI